MKPNFALNLSLEGISLLRRLPRGWELVGETDLHPPALKRRLARLREAALGGSTERLTTKLILPESQVLYTSIASPGRDDVARREAIAKALDGMTPYPVDDLAFDFESDGEMLHVAVVARETIEEAESFALEHAFNPVSIVAHPKGGSFTGEPFFGETAAAAELLPKGTRVQRDVLPTQVTLKLTAPVVPGENKGVADETAVTADKDAASTGNEPSPDQGTAPEPTPEDAALDVADEAAETPGENAEATPAVAAASEPDVSAEDEAERALARALSEPLEDEAPPVASDEAEDDSGEDAPPEAARESPEAAASDAAGSKPDVTAEDDRPALETPAAEDPSPTTSGEQEMPAPSNAHTKRHAEITATADGLADAGVAYTARMSEDLVDPELVSATLDRDETDKAEAGEALSVSKPSKAVQATDAEDKAATGGKQATAPEPTEDSSEPKQPEEAGGDTPEPETQPVFAEPPPTLGAAPARLGVASGELPPIAPLPPVAKPSLLAKPLKAKAPPFATAPEPLRKVLARPHPIPDTKAEDADGEGLTGSTNIFGARRSERRRASPLTFVVLTAGLVAFIGAVALWSALFGSGGAPEPAADAPEISALPAPVAPLAPAEPVEPVAPAEQASAAETIAPAEPTAPAESLEPVELAAPAEPGTEGADLTGLAQPAEAEAQPSAPAEPAPAPVEEVATAEPAQPEASVDTPQATPEPSEDDIAVAYAATGIWSRAPETPAQAREERLTAPLRGAVDSRVPERPDPALRTTGADQIDDVPSEPEAPPPPGVVYRLDERGLVEPLPEGAPTPTGTIVYLGRPALVPPGRGGTAVPEAETPETSSDALAAAVEGALADLPLALPGTPDTPPRPRPEGLVAAPAPEATPDPAPDATLEPDPTLEPVPEPESGETPTDAALPAAEAANPLAEFRPRPRPNAATTLEPDSDVALSPPQTGAGEGAASEPTGSSSSSDPALAGVRPQPRPFSQPPDVAETALTTPEPGGPAAPDVTRLQPPGDPALAGFRPRPRIGATPGSDSIDGVSGAETEATVIEAAATAAAPRSFPDASELAVAVTPVPQARPRGFVERAAAAQAAAAVAAATQAAASAVVMTPEPEAEAEADGEAAEVTAVVAAPSGGPRLPTRASVAEQATVENAIRLNQVNLIGIYGSSSDRRALVRLPSGRYVKVEVGDRVDGGRVAAISDRELRLVKNGRNVVLRIAQGG